MRADDQAHRYVHKSRYLCKVIAKTELAFGTNGTFMEQDR